MSWRTKEIERLIKEKEDLKRRFDIRKSEGEYSVNDFIGCSKKQTLNNLQAYYKEAEEKIELYKNMTDEEYLIEVTIKEREKRIEYLESILEYHKLEY